MEKEFIKSVAQLMLEGVPLSPAELKEMILRHLLADPTNQRNENVTRGLLGTYEALLKRDGQEIGYLSYAVVPDYLRDAYNEGWRHVSNTQPDVFAWPLALPERDLPKDIVVQFGNALGYIAGQSRQAR